MTAPPPSAASSHLASAKASEQSILIEAHPRLLQPAHSDDLHAAALTGSRPTASSPSMSTLPPALRCWLQLGSSAYFAAKASANERPPTRFCPPLFGTGCVGMQLVLDVGRTGPQTETFELACVWNALWNPSRFHKTRLNSNDAWCHGREGDFED